MTYQTSEITDSVGAPYDAPESISDEAEAAETVASTTPATDHDAASANDELLGELARAMHTAASSQYGRMNAELERRRTEQVDAIAARVAAEAESLKAGSDADIGAIDAWAKTETEKIKLERLLRIDARREQLAVQLERQEIVRQREVFAIEVAIDAHRNEIDAFFGRMERETDPAAIAQVASTLPSFPALAEIVENARRSAAAEFATLGATTLPSEGAASAGTGADERVDRVDRPELVPVMDPDVAPGTTSDEPRPWEAPYAVSVAAGSIPAEPPPVVAEGPSRVGSTLLRTVRAIRPMGGDRHERSDEER